MLNYSVAELRIQYNDYIEYFYYLCDVEKEEPAGS